MGKRQLLPGPVHELHCQVQMEMRDQVWAAAEAQDLSPSQWIRRAIRNQLEREQKASR